MEPSKYINRFTNAGEMKESVELIGDCLLVEKIKDEELTTKSGLIIATSSRQIGTFAENKPVWVRVLMVGEGYYDSETDTSIPLNAKPGDIALVGQVSTKWFSVFGELKNYEPETIGLTRESEIQLRFKGEDGFKTTFERLNS